MPAEILEWLGIEFYNDKDYAAAEKYLTALSKSDNLSSVKPDFWFYLGDAQTKLNQPAEAETRCKNFSQTATDPAAKAKTLLALGAAKIGAHKPDDAQKIAEEIMTLQPEGPGECGGAIAGGRRRGGAPAIRRSGQGFHGRRAALRRSGDYSARSPKRPRPTKKPAKQRKRSGPATQLHEKYPDYAGG